MKTKFSASPNSTAASFRLYLPIPSRDYQAQDLGLLQRALEDRMTHTRIEEIGRVEDLVISPNGQVGGFRYTETAFHQVCNLAAPGLYGLTKELIGERGRGECDPDEISFDMARRMFNQTVVLRKRRLVGRCRLLYNDRTKQIEGVLGPAFQQLDNRTVLEHALETAAAMTPESRLSWASLCGPLLVLRFTARQPLCQVQLPGGLTTFRNGLHVVNSEISGEASFRAALMLSRDDDGAVSLGKWLGGRVTHTGRDLPKRVALAFAAAVDRERNATRTAAQLQQLASQSLLKGQLSAEQRKERTTEIAGRLRDGGAQASLANRVVGNFVATAGLLSLDDSGDRSYYDLYSALIVEAQGVYVLVRETLEQAAHKLLIDEIRFH